MRTKIVKWGNGLALRIPKSIAEAMRIQEGTAVELSLEGRRLVMSVPAEAEYSLDKLLTRVTATNLHRGVDSGNAVGEEHW